MKLSILLIFIVKLAKKHVSVECKEVEGKNAQITSLQSWLDNQVQNRNPLVGISAFVVAGSGDNPAEVVTSGNAIIASAWDATNSRGVSNVEKAVTSDSTCMLASTSKPFTWTALSMLLDAGKFELDDAIDDALSFQVRNPRFPNVPVTYRHLYSHTSGIKDDYNRYKYGNQCPADEMFPYSFSESLESSVKRLTDQAGKWTTNRPGTRYLYSNYGTALAGLLVEKHSGMSFPEFTKKYIFEPLQMTSAQWTRPSDGTAAELYTLHQMNGFKYKTNPGAYCYPDYPSGQLWMTAGDLAKFAIAMLKRGNLGYTTSDGATCLYSEAMGASVFEKSSPSTGDGDSGLGWFVGDPGFPGGAGHDGAETGVSADLFIGLNNDIAIGYWANGELTNNLYQSINRRLQQTANAIGSIDNPYNANNPKDCRTVLSTDGTTSTPPSPTSPTPTSSPTSSPVTSSSCTDTSLEFKVRINGRIKFKTCSWVEKATGRCNRAGVSAACPSTCGSCSTCDDSTLQFKVVKKDGSKMKRRCSWVNNWRCSNFDGVAEACRLTCGSCSDN